jgi:hypothetical protein
MGACQAKPSGFEAIIAARYHGHTRALNEVYQPKYIEELYVTVGTSKETRIYIEALEILFRDNILADFYIFFDWVCHKDLVELLTTKIQTFDSLK